MVVLRIGAVVTVVLFAASEVASQGSSTAGVPVSQNAGNGQTSVGIPAGQNGQSTGSQATFQPGATSAGPSMSVVSSTLTGAAASEASASLASASSQGLGSDGMYTTTTGSLIAGISNSLSGGYDQATSTIGQSSATAAINSSPRQAQGGASGSKLQWVAVGAATVLGAMIVL